MDDSSLFITGDLEGPQSPLGGFQIQQFDETLLSDIPLTAESPTPQTPNSNMTFAFASPAPRVPSPIKTTGRISLPIPVAAMPKISTTSSVSIPNPLMAPSQPRKEVVQVGQTGPVRTPSPRERLFFGGPMMMDPTKAATTSSSGTLTLGNSQLGTLVNSTSKQQQQNPIQTPAAAPDRLPQEVQSLTIPSSSLIITTEPAVPSNTSTVAPLLPPPPSSPVVMKMPSSRTSVPLSAQQQVSLTVVSASSSAPLTRPFHPPQVGSGIRPVPVNPSPSVFRLTKPQSARPSVPRQRTVASNIVRPQYKGNASNPVLSAAGIGPPKQIQQSTQSPQSLQRSSQLKTYSSPNPTTKNVVSVSSSVSGISRQPTAPQGSSTPTPTIPQPQQSKSPAMPLRTIASNIVGAGTNSNFKPGTVDKVRSKDNASLQRGTTSAAAGVRAEVRLGPYSRPKNNGKSKLTDITREDVSMLLMPSEDWSINVYPSPNPRQGAFIYVISETKLNSNLVEYVRKSISLLPNWGMKFSVMATDVSHFNLGLNVSDITDVQAVLDKFNTIAVCTGISGKPSLEDAVLFPDRVYRKRKCSLLIVNWSEKVCQHCKQL